MAKRSDLTIPSRKSLEKIRKSCYNHQLKVATLIDLPIEPFDNCLKYLMEIYSICGEVITLIDEYMTDADPEDEVFLNKEDITTLLTFTRVLESASSMLNKYHNISLALN